MTRASVRSAGLSSVVTTGIGIGTANPVAAVTGALSFAGWLMDRWPDASAQPLREGRPTKTLTEAINTIAQPELSPEWLRDIAATRSPNRASDEAAIARRASEIAHSPEAGTDFDNWARAVIELKVAQRAAEIARSSQAGSDYDHWVRAERELKVAQKAEEIARSPDAGNDYDNWLRAEQSRHVRGTRRTCRTSRAAWGTAS
jgi:hypothetical protein